ncbi:hypothetical protein KFF05_02500 [bacterium SCSIO 12827]|nr:hypothetical protein KFF05_02500 [bacterium SCSIO 12827]
MFDGKQSASLAGPRAQIREAFRLPLVWNLILVFVLIVVAVCAAIIYFNHHQNSALTYGYTANVINDIARRIRSRLDLTLRPILALAHDAEKFAVPPGGEPLNPEMRRFVTAFMEINPQILSVYFATGDEQFRQIYNVVDGREVDWGQVRVPPSARFAMRHLQGAPSAPRNETWVFFDSEQREIGPPFHSVRQYDARTRPWHVAALRADGTVLSRPYAFATLGVVGVTASKRAGEEGVFGVDMTLSDLSRVLNDLEFSGDGTAVIFTGDGTVIAYSNARKLIVNETKGVFRAAKIAELEDPVVDAMFRAARSSLAGGEGYPSIADIGEKRSIGFSGQTSELLTFNVNGVAHVSHVVGLDGLVGPNVFLGIALQKTDVLQGVDELTIQSLTLSLLFLLCGTSLVILVARNLARPISDLVLETDVIRRLELDNPVLTRSRVAEVQDLASSIGSLKTTVKGLGRYIPQGVANNLITHGSLPELGGDNRMVSVLFTDAAGFTKLSELMSPQDLMRKLSSYFEVLSEEILAENGAIDKYIGDSIMAVWNGIEDDANHVIHACRAALRCEAENDRLNAMWRSYGWPEIQTRFGLHCGEAVVGNVGSETRMDHTTIGACVNMASRLEGLNKIYGTRILISEDVYKVAKDHFLTRPVDRVRPVGSTIPVTAYELVGFLDGDDAHATDADRRRCASWSEIYVFCQSRDWPNVCTALEAYRAEYPEDDLARVFAERMHRYVATPPGEDWDGVWDSDRK